MDLKSYLSTMQMPEREAFAERCGTSYGHLRNVAYGSKTCAESLAINVDRESRGVVRCEDLRPDVDWAYLRAADRRSGTDRRSGGDRHKSDRRAEAA